ESVFVARSNEIINERLVGGEHPKIRVAQHHSIGTVKAQVAKFLEQPLARERAYALPDCPPPIAESAAIRAPPICLHQGHFIAKATIWCLHFESPGQKRRGDLVQVLNTLSRRCGNNGTLLAFERNSEHIAQIPP